MTTFNNNAAFVWVWLPNATKPIVAGKLEKNTPHHDFYYGQSYLNSPNAIALSPSELPLLEGKRLTSDREIHRVINDAVPDAWGRRVLFHQYQTTGLSLIDMLLFSSTDRIGALHFQQSESNYKTHDESNATLDQLTEAVALIESGQPLPKDLTMALMHGTSIGGARPKALIQDNNKKFITKFSASTDPFPLVQAEYASMYLAKKLGLNTAHVKLQKTNNKFVLLVERFDRELQNEEWSRKFIVSALTMLGLDETEGRYASYIDLSDIIRRDCKNPLEDLRELYRRMVFNILIGNTDDHAKNHSFFWDGQQFQLTPGYDICPYLRAGQEATQAMTVGEYGAQSTIKNALTATDAFQLTEKAAQEEIDKLISGIKKYWPEACEKAHLTEFQMKQLTKTAVLNPYCFC